ncbi:ABC transporter permease [Arthrobacter sp. B2a2-09]|uniref:ABC transporter permease n=1 Tax=Arthrobacter sp. B2a2-09 TaxID=2952822 RepID=UPI0022CD6535|nr:ABC transporter permease [Arthrobacter sp. B2a2-09]MCZ9883474.1 ABC transporter permease [Arthrobacter sp. B2a2-09]
MAASETAVLATAPGTPAPGRLASVRHRLGWIGMVCTGIVAVVVLAALVGQFLVPYDPTVGSVVQRHLGSSAEHLLGTDQAGRDIFSRLIAGARTSLVGPLIVVVATAVAGSMLALTAVWFGGRMDAFLGRVLDVLFAFPSLLLAILGVAIFGPGLVTASIALAVAYIPYSARVIRSVALRERNLPYVKAAELQGINGFTITLRHILPNVWTQILTGSTINFGYAIVDLAALSFLGLGIQPPAADWGLMISNGQESLQQGFPEQSLYAGLCIVATVAAMAYLGERLGGRAAAGRSKQ